MVDRGLFDDQQGHPSSPHLDFRIPNREGSKVLPADFVPGEWDVICHSSKDTQNHIGNRRFDLCVENHIEAYSKAKSRVEKSVVISDIVASIRESSTTGSGFVRYDIRIERWYEVGDKVARDKVGQSLRVKTSNKKKAKISSPSKNTILPSMSETAFPSSALSPILSTDIEKARKDESMSYQLPDNTSPIDEMMMQTSMHAQQEGGKKQRTNDSSDESPSDNSLIAWFEADSRGTK